MLTDQLYMIFYAGQSRGERPTHDLPDSAMGRAVALALRAIGGTLNRVGVMHTRYLFTPNRPMRCEVRR
jgi:hypothetical protein